MDGAKGSNWDILIRNALVFDGTGGPSRRVDVAVSDGKVAAMGANLPQQELSRTMTR